MKRIIVYRYYHKFEHNKNLLEFLKYLNPNVPVYGIYGGDEAEFDTADNLLSEYLSDNYLIKNKSNDWKWKNSDMTMQLWYNDFGHTLDFDIVHLIEWDLLFFDSLENLYHHIPENSLALTGLIPIQSIFENWYWTTKERRKEYLDLVDFFKNKYNIKDEYGTLGPGTSLPKYFLEKIRYETFPEKCTCELRYPLLAQAFGFNMTDTGFFKKWLNKKEFKYFNANNYFIDIKTIKKQLKKKKGRRVFHPFRDEISAGELIELHKLTIQ